MSEPNPASSSSSSSGGGPDRQQMLTALFAGVVMQQTNMALMFLGKTPNPETGKPVRDLEAAQMFIDTLEMLEEKTKGNLNAEEQRLLRESLTTVRLAFVEAANEPAPAAGATQSQSQPTGAGASASSPDGRGATASAPSDQAKPADQPASEEEGPRKRFTKKY